MITTVVDERGALLHDCKRDGCSVSWDGFALRDLEPADLHADAATRLPNLQAVAQGKRVPGATDPDAALYDVRGPIARLKTDR